VPAQALRGVKSQWCSSQRSTGMQVVVSMSKGRQQRLQPAVASCRRSFGDGQLASGACLALLRLDWAAQIGWAWEGPWTLDWTGAGSLGPCHSMLLAVVGNQSTARQTADADDERAAINKSQERERGRGLCRPEPLGLARTPCREKSQIAYIYIQPSR